MTATSDQIRAALPEVAVEGFALSAPVIWPEDRSTCPVILRIIESFLITEATMTKAQKALAAIGTDLVDINELRVALPAELVGIIGIRYPQSRERCERLRMCLQAIYERENCAHLTHLADLSKRDCRAYLDSLPGMTPYVSARVVLIEFGGHAFPVDSRVRTHLRSIGCDSDSNRNLAGKLERMFRAGELTAIHAALELALDPAAAKSGSPSR